MITMVNDKAISASQLIDISQQLNFDFECQQLKHSHFNEAQNIYTAILRDLESIQRENTAIRVFHENIIRTLLTTFIHQTEDHLGNYQKLETFVTPDEKEATTNNSNNEQKLELDELKAKYEEKISLLSNNLQDTIAALESSCKEQLQERQDLVRELLKQLNDKNAEFAGYIATLTADHERKIIQLKIQYEEKLKIERDERLLLQTENGVLSRKLEYANGIIAALENDKSHLLSDLQNKKQMVEQLEHEIGELRFAISKTDEKMSRKERFINNLDKHTQKLEKHKVLLNKKIVVIQQKGEPILIELKNKNAEIEELKENLSQWRDKHNALLLQLDKLKLKIRGSECQLRDEIQKRQLFQSKIMNISREIFLLMEHLDNVVELKRGVMDLYQKSELK